MLSRLGRLFRDNGLRVRLVSHRSLKGARTRSIRGFGEQSRTISNQACIVSGLQLEVGSLKRAGTFLHSAYSVIRSNRI
jgi:hypothetical protein